MVNFISIKYLVDYIIYGDEDVSIKLFKKLIDK